uniref:uncharacterized protein LOC117610452 n=1 Tax=Osmia lignaria TaxID=473952 RepID=UPI00147899DE|nr:uncharacterized protein LOC117610452 [Osmia lignaria]
MSHLETNKWTPKLIIVFQLTIWSIVGIILLQKGAISLREKMKPRNDTADVQDKLARWNGKESIREPTNVTDSSRRHIIKVYQTGTRRWTNVATDNVDDVTSNEWLSRKLHPSHRTRNINRESFKKTLTIGERTTITTTVGHEYDTRGARAIETVAVHVNNKNKIKNINHEENVIVSLASNERSYDTENTVINNITPNILFEFENAGSANLARPDRRKSFEHDVNDITTYETTGDGKSETKPRRSPVNRIGAAIAIIMLVIGIIMLLLGPFIVILRALNNRRRTRETLDKKRNPNDRPPTYEEATLMDQAPRYSTLQLDTILESSFSL